MKPFSAPLDDIMFSLRHIAGADRIAEFDADTTAEIAGHFAAFAQGEIAPLNASADVEGCRLENGRVRMPKGFADVYQSYVAQGWPGLSAPEEFGGQGGDALTAAVVSEIFSGACHSLQMVAGLVPGAITALIRHGSDDQRQRMVPKLAQGDWLATMCLTEAGAGSDLSQIRCRAMEADESWTIEGEKIFISGGDQDVSAGILHLVLARTSDDGLRGLSLFACPSEKPDGTRNGVRVERIEDKMGLHASPTCQLVFDSAYAELIGAPGGGLAAMFSMMNHARLDVAMQGVAHAARAHDIAADYAAERVQGRTHEGTPAHLADHPDVARMLDEADAYALSARAMAHIALVALERGDRADLVEFLTPLSKIYASECGMKSSELGQQVLGGYGYLHEYGLEQIYRDARITAIYEGANGIHANALVFRHVRGKGGGSEAFGRFLRDECDAHPDQALERSVALWHEATDRIIGLDPSAAARVAMDFAQLSAAVMCHLIWQRYARASDQGFRRDSSYCQRQAVECALRVKALHERIMTLSAKVASRGAREKE